MKSSQVESVVVVGAGVVGLACGHYLSRAGYKVTLIDRGTVGGACSHGNCGYICPSHVLPLTEPGAFRVALKSLFNPNAPFRVKPQFSPALFRWMLEFARRCTHRQMLAAGVHLKAILDSSLAEYKRLVTEEHLDCQWKSTGLLYVMRSPHALDEFAHTDKLLTEHFGVSARRIDGADLPAFDAALKPGLAGGFLYEGDCTLRPDALTRDWADKLRARGVTIIEQCQLQHVERSQGRIARLSTSQGTFEADRYVIAAGAWSAQLAAELGCRIPIQPGKGYSVTMQRPEPCPRHSMLFPEHRVGVTPFDDGYRLGSMMEFAGFDETIPERRIQQLRDAAVPYLVAPHTPGPARTWYGWRPMTWDSLPIIGPVPRLSNALLATGHNMLGMSLATGTGRLVAELVQQQPTHIDVQPFSPLRFN